MVARVLIPLIFITSLNCGGGGGGGGGVPPAPPPGAATTNFSTYLGSGEEAARDVAADASGNTYVVGGTQSNDFPTTPGTAQPNFGGFEDAYVLKLDPQGRVVWGTYLGGAELDRAYAVEVSGNDVIVAGRAGATFPVTPGVIQTQFQGSSTDANYPQPQDGFVAKLRASNGTLVWATFFGAGNDDPSNIVRDVAVDDATGFIYIASSTLPAGTYPTAILNALQNGHQPNKRGGTDGVLAKLSSDGTTMPWATYVGGSGNEWAEPSVRVDSQGRPLVLYTSTSADDPITANTYDALLSGGRDWYVAKYEINGALSWATYVGGDAGEGTETHNLAIRADDTVIVAAASSSSDLTANAASPYDGTQNGNGGAGSGLNTNYASDCGIVALSADGRQLLGATYYGGSAGEACEGVGADSNGNIYVSGATFSSNLPMGSSALQSIKPGTLSPFVAVFSRDLSKLRYSSYYGGSGDSTGRDIAVHAEGHFVFGGEAGTGWPLHNAIRTNVTANATHAGVADLTVPLGPG